MEILVTNFICRKHTRQLGSEDVKRLQGMGMWSSLWVPGFRHLGSWWIHSGHSCISHNTCTQPLSPTWAPEMLLPAAALQRSLCWKALGLLPEGCLSQSSDKEGRTGEGSEKENLHWWHHTQLKSNKWWRIYNPLPWKRTQMVQLHEKLKWAVLNDCGHDQHMKNRHAINW